MDSLDVSVETLPGPRWRFHIESPLGTQWLCDHTTVQEWNSGCVFDLDRTVEMCQEMHFDGLNVGEKT